jgi:DNA primase
MATWVDFDSIKATVSLEQVLLHYNLLDNMTRKGNRVSGLCAFHPDAKTKSFKADLEKNCWICFGACKRGGDQIDLVCVAERISTGHRTSDRRCAALLLQEWFGLTPAAPAKAKRAEDSTSRHRTEERVVDDQRHPHETGEQASAGPESTQPEVINPPLGFSLKNLDHERAYAYAEGRGISRATAEQFGLAVALAGGYKGRLVIPLIDHQEGVNVLVGYAARALDESEPKYLFPSREKGFFKSHLVYHLALVRERAAVIVEGFFDCIKVTQAGYPCVCVMGSDVSDRQAEILCARFERMVLFFDGDAAGRQGTDRALVALGRRGRYVRAVLVPDGSQPDELSEEEIKRLLTR